MSIITRIINKKQIKVDLSSCCNNDSVKTMKDETVIVTNEILTYREKQLQELKERREYVFSLKYS